MAVVRGQIGCVQLVPLLLALTSLSFGRTHQADHSINWVNPAKLDEVTALVTNIVRAVQAKTPAWSRP